MHSAGADAGDDAASGISVRRRSCISSARRASRSAQYSSRASLRNSDGWNGERADGRPTPGPVDRRRRGRARTAATISAERADQDSGMTAGARSGTARAVPIHRPTDAEHGPHRLLVEEPPRRVALVQLSDRRRRQHHHQAEHDEHGDDHGDHVELRRSAAGCGCGPRGRRAGWRRDRRGALQRLAAAVADQRGRRCSSIRPLLSKLVRATSRREVVAARRVAAVGVPVEAGAGRRQQHGVAGVGQSPRRRRRRRPSTSASRTGQHAGERGGDLVGGLADGDHGRDPLVLGGQARRGRGPCCGRRRSARRASKPRIAVSAACGVVALESLYQRDPAGLADQLDAVGRAVERRPAPAATAVGVGQPGSSTSAAAASALVTSWGSARRIVATLGERARRADELRRRRRGSRRPSAPKVTCRPGARGEVAHHDRVVGVADRPTSVGRWCDQMRALAAS